MSQSVVVTIPFADHGIGATLTDDAAVAVLAGPHAGHVVRAPDAPATDPDAAPADDPAPVPPTAD